MTMRKESTSNAREAFFWAALVAALFFGVGCEVTKTEEGEMPDVDVEGDAGELPEYEVVKTDEGRMPSVDVDVDPGKLPEYDIDAPDVEVGTRQTKVTVPKVKVVLEEEEVTVPYIDVDLPGEDDDAVRSERQITVKVAVPNAGYDVEIKEIHVVDDELWVVSELKELGAKRGGPVTVSDTVVVKTKDMDVKHYVIGTPVQTSENDGFDFIRSRSELPELRSARPIYTS